MNQNKDESISPLAILHFLWGAVSGSSLIIFLAAIFALLTGCSPFVRGPTNNGSGGVICSRVPLDRLPVDVDFVEICIPQAPMSELSP